MQWERNDGGREAAGFRGTAGDCVVRAVAIATGQPYQIVYDALSDGCRAQRVTKRTRGKASARNGVNVKRKWFRDYMIALGWRWTPTMLIGSGCKVHLVDGELPMGRLIVSVSKHYTCVIDGVIQDEFDPQRRTFWYTGNKLDRISERCVYGYWSVPDVS